MIVVVATNHPELLDRAVWRRFQSRLTLPAASREGIVSFLDRWVARSGVGLGYAHRTLADKLKGQSYAEVEEFVTTVQRRLSGPGADERLVVGSCLDQWKDQIASSTA